MLSPLRNVEARIEQLLERDFVKLWQHHLHPNTLVRELARALENRATYNVDQGKAPSAPTIYNVHINKFDAANLLHHVPRFPELMSQQLIVVARELNLIMLDPPVVNIIAVDDLPANDFHITTEISPVHDNHTQTIINSTRNQGLHMPPHLSAYIIVNGRNEILLTQPLITIGRSTKNTIILEDAGASRSHAQLRLLKHTWTIFDLNSRRGTSVNGEHIGQSPLHSGDVITLASSQLIFATEKHHAGSSNQTKPLSNQTEPLQNPKQPS